MDYCTDSLVLKSLDYFQTIMTAYWTTFAFAGSIALLILVCMLCTNERTD